MGRPLAIASAFCLLFAAGVTRADILTGPIGPSGTYTVGVDPTWGNVYQTESGVGLRRDSDGFDPIAPGTPREAWGIAAGGTAGYADPNDFGVVNITPGALAGGVITNTLDAGAGALLSLTQSYSFIASNVVQITQSITNVSGVSQAVTYARNVDWDIDPTPFVEYTKNVSATSPITAASFYGFESPSPLDAFGSPATPGVVNGPGDLGAGFQLDLGTLAPGATVSFNVYYGLSMFDQLPGDLTAEILGLAPGLWGITTGASSETGDFNTAANSVSLAIGPITVSTIPEPSSLAIFAVSGLSLAGYGLRRRRTS